MKIKNFEFSDPYDSGWKLSPLNLNDHINLFVGASGAGKTRVLNMLFNIAAAVVQGNRFLAGKWTLTFEHSDHEFRWEYDGNPTNGEEASIGSEALYAIEGESETLLFSREDSQFVFGGTYLPKIGKTQIGIHVFREEPAISPAFKGFELLLRRTFSGADLQQASAIEAYPYAFLQELKKSKIRKISDVFGKTNGLHLRLFVLKQFYPKYFERIQQIFCETFPSVTAIVTGAASRHLQIAFGMDAPLILIEEKGVRKPTPLNELSSGMLKVLLITTDIITAPKGLLYLIDEYENSLGANAIDFLPELLVEHSDRVQFIITSHHPYLINEIPIEDWFVFRRVGASINVTHGTELAEKYGRSKQQRFIQLINDPAFSGK